MTTEIELKLKIAPADINLFLQLPLLTAAGAPHRRLLVSRYFDTPALELMRCHAALRVRRVGEQWIQTVKIGGTAVNGLHTRPEWEIPVPDSQPHPQLFTEPAVRAILPEPVASRLQPVFQTEFWRSTWLVDFQDSRIEVALDQGEVRSLERSEPICEIELELKSGRTEALIALADQFSRHVALTADSISKAQRGYALYQAQHAVPS